MLKLGDSTDILLLPGAHLTDDAPDAAIQIPGYTVLHNDSRNIKIHGVCAYLSNLSSTTICVLHSRILYFIYFIVVVYISPSCSAMENAKLLTWLLDVCTGKEAIFLVDFSLRSLNWKSPDYSGKQLLLIHNSLTLLTHSDFPSGSPKLPSFVLET